MGFFKKVRKTFKGAADAGKKKAGEVADFTVDVNERAVDFAVDSTKTAANAAAEGVDTAAGKAGDALTPKNAPRRI